MDANVCKTIHIQDAINNIGGVICLLPILEDLKHIDPSTKVEMMSRVSLSQKHVKTSDGEWELVNEAYASEMKIYLNPLASFLCLLRNFITNNELNQECLLKSDCIGIISKMIYDCHPDLLDVNVLMALQTLVEAVQAEVHKSNMQLLDTFYNELVFDFRIWARAEFQIVIGHVQHLYATIKVDRKYFRKHFGVQYMLDVIQQFFVTNDVLTANDGKTVRDALFRIIRYYILKEISHKEVSALITFLLTIKSDIIIVEVLEMLNNVMQSKNCNDQIFLLIYEPSIGELLYALVAEKSLDQSTQAVLVKFLGSVLNTEKIGNRHKNNLRLIDPSIECNSLYHGLYSFLFPIDLSSNIILSLLDMNLSLDTAIGYSAALCIIYHLNLASLQLKVEISRRLLTCTFTKTKSPQLIAKQIGWQESLARLLIKKPIELVSIGEKDKSLLLSDVEELFNTEFEV